MEDITAWDYDDLTRLPKGESADYEYKSSRISLDDLRTKISIAASAFWNSGGGLFVAGVDDNGLVDGGVPERIGRQSLRDWTDRAISQTVPLGLYKVNVIEHSPLSVDIKSERAVLVIQFQESRRVPHMAADRKYYIRAGAHSEGATHFQIEALRALRTFATPYLRGVLRLNPDRAGVEEIAIVALNDAVA